MKVYVVLMGDYEFRGIHSIHSTRELAQALIDRTGDSSADIEEYDVDEIDPTTLPFERRKFQVTFTPTGAVKEVRFASTFYSGNDYSRRVEVTVWATTREEAVTEARPIFTAWREGRIPGDGRENVFVLGRPEAGEYEDMPEISAAGQAGLDQWYRERDAHRIEPEEAGE